MTERGAVIVSSYLVSSLVASLAIVLPGLMMKPPKNLDEFFQALIMLAVFSGSFAGYFAIPAGFLISYLETGRVRSVAPYLIWSTAGGLAMGLFISLPLALFWVHHIRKSLR